MAQKVTQALIYQEILTIKDKLAEHTVTDTDNFKEIKHILEGTSENPGFKVRMDRLEQVEKNRHSHIGYIWSAIVTVAAGLILKLWVG